MSSRRFHRPLSFLAATCVPALFACGGLPMDLRDILPDDGAVALHVPGAQIPTAAGVAPSLFNPLVGSASQYQSSAAGIATLVNGQVLDLVHRIRGIADYPPNSVQGNTYTWGPYSPGGLDPLNYRFTAVKNGTARYDIRLEARPSSDAAAEFVVLLDGTVESVLNGTGDGGKGNFTVHLDARRQLDENWMARGEVAITYDASVEPRLIGVTLTGFDPSAAMGSVTAAGGLGGSGLHAAANADPAADTLVSDYRYTEAQDSSGTFHFSLRMNVQDGSLPAAETVTLNARWDASGRGRADATISGDDVPVQLQQLGVQGSTLRGTECWDQDFIVVFQDSDPPELRQSLRPLQGDPTACAFADADYPAAP